MKKAIVALDLDGILAIGDTGFEVFKEYGYGKVFRKHSNAIADAVMNGENWDGKKAYAGQTLEYTLKHYIKRKRRPIAVKSIVRHTKSARMMRGAKKLVQALKQHPGVKDVYIVSTTYKPGADVIASRLGIPFKNVIATKLRVDRKGRIKGIEGEACGGTNKLKALRKIKDMTGVPLSEFIVIGDSITDMNFVRAVTRKGGLGIAFNATEDLIQEKPTITIASASLHSAFPFIDAFLRKGHKGVESLARRSIAGYKLTHEGLIYVVPRSKLTDKNLARTVKVSFRRRQKERGRKIATLR